MTRFCCAQPSSVTSQAGSSSDYPEYPYAATDYTEPFRAQFHFSPQNGFMNDINATNWADQTPLRLAEGHFYSGTFLRYPETAALLKKLGANPQAGTQLMFGLTGYVEDKDKKDESRKEQR